MRLRRNKKPTPPTGFGVIPRTAIVSALEKARANDDAPAIASGLRLLTVIDESGLDYLAWPL